MRNEKLDLLEIMKSGDKWLFQETTDSILNKHKVKVIKLLNIDEYLNTLKYKIDYCAMLRESSDL